MPGEIKDLDVERVDGVDKPATGHKWLIVKSVDQLPSLLSEEPDEFKANAMVVIKAAQEALLSLIDDDVIVKSDAAAGKLTELAKLLTIEKVFAAAKAADPGATCPMENCPMKKKSDSGKQGDQKSPDATPLADVIATLQKAITDLPQTIAKAVVTQFEKELEGDDEQETKDVKDVKKSETKSKQVKDQDRVEKTTKAGLFTNVIFS